MIKKITIWSILSVIIMICLVITQAIYQSVLEIQGGFSNPIFLGIIFVLLAYFDYRIDVIEKLIKKGYDNENI